jgi:hypothetical protein
MPLVAGFLRRVRRSGGGGRPVDPDYGIDEGEGPVDPDFGVDGEGDGIWGGPIVPPSHRPLPKPPPGIWPPMTPDNPWLPVPGHPLPRPPVARPPGLPPGGPETLPEEPPEFPPGAIWPPLPPGVEGKYLALILLKGANGWRWHYTVIDADASFPKPEPKPPEAQPK